LWIPFNFQNKTEARALWPTDKDFAGIALDLQRIQAKINRLHEKFLPIEAKYTPLHCGSLQSKTVPKDPLLRLRHLRIKPMDVDEKKSEEGVKGESEEQQIYIFLL